MKTIALNKNFNKKYIYDSIKELFMPRWRGYFNTPITYQNRENFIKDDDTINTVNVPEPEKQQKIRWNQQLLFDRKLNPSNEDISKFDDKPNTWRNIAGVNGKNLRNYVQPTLFYVVEQSYIDLLDKINLLLYNKQIPLTNPNEDEAHTRFLNLMGSFHLADRRTAFHYLLSKGLITQDEYDATALNNIATEQYRADKFSIKYEPLNDYYIINHETPLRLEKRWVNDINNPNNRELYIMMELHSTLNFNNYNYDAHTVYSRTNATKFFREDTGHPVYQYGYLAFTLGDLASDKDIQFDHVDKIDYLDSIEVAIKLPKFFN